ncbi:flavin reductase family protein [Candidatus Woesearchaeota archaeon]|nr:flavin reductase family protein [Candidatus Woesearchaeota archaeon]
MAEMRDVVNPRQVILITSRAHMVPKFRAKEEEKDNVMTAAWHMPVAFEPPLYAISVGKKRYSLDIIRKGRSFVVNFMPYSMKKEVLLAGRISGEHIDKFAKIGLEKEDAETIDSCRLKDALACLECEVEQEIEAGDHIIFIGRVLKVIKKKGGKRIYQIGGDKFSTIT